MKPVHNTRGWSGDQLDLAAYLDRIAFTGPVLPDLATLRALQRAHTTAIPFENLEIILGRTIPLDLKSLQDKIIRRQRGGYCYENVLLFAAALERIGFGVTGLQARVTLGATEVRPATHAILRVTVPGDERVWLCDVGFGRGPLEPIELISDGSEINQDGWLFRLERTTAELGTDLWVLHQFGREGWVDRHTFPMEPKYLIDYVVGNHYVSTSPRSPFTTRPYVQRFHVDSHHVLDGTTWITDGPEGTRHTRELEPAELPKVLAEYFDIHLTEEDAALLATGPWITNASE